MCLPGRRHPGWMWMGRMGEEGAWVSDGDGVGGVGIRHDRIKGLLPTVRVPPVCVIFFFFLSLPPSSSSCIAAAPPTDSAALELVFLLTAS